MQRSEPQRPKGELVLRPATEDETPRIREVLEDARQWLHQRGIRQWPPDHPARTIEYTREHGFFDRGEFHIAEIRNQAVGTIILTEDAGDLWDSPENALYIYAFAVKRSFSGRGIGKAVRCWAERAAVQQGKTSLRLDTAASNQKLCQYYTDAGFRALGAHREQPWYMLFEKKVEQRSSSPSG